ncbi:putative metal tolerance protein 4-like protein [Tanacetum coccineum]
MPPNQEHVQLVWPLWSDLRVIPNPWRILLTGQTSGDFCMFLLGRLNLSMLGQTLDSRHKMRTKHALDIITNLVELMIHIHGLTVSEQRDDKNVANYQYICKPATPPPKWELLEFGSRFRKLYGFKGCFAACFLVYGSGFANIALLRVEKVARQKMQVNKHLKRLNKKPVKTIESPDGDKIDCVHISQQPAFDHPFLKDHKIQMRPNYHPEGLYDDNKMNTESKGKENTMHQLWHHHRSVPVPRNVNIPKSADPDIDNESGHQVSPDLYGDNNTRLFTYWTSDAYQATGCYNLLCSGFIQINSNIAMGASISPVSGFRNSQYDISILVWKDQKEGNWWMQFGNGYVLGYWPSFLFSYLADSASMIEWGGEVVIPNPTDTTHQPKWAAGVFQKKGLENQVISETFK